MSQGSSSLAQKLVELGYPALFKDAGHEYRLDETWDRATQHNFERLVNDADVPALARFLSSQILLRKDMTFLSRTNLNSLSDVYVQALLGNFTNDMSDWGFLRGNEDLGVVGSIFLIFGERSVPKLMDLLSDGRVVEYERGPSDVSGLDRTILRRIRMKDFAALYLSKIKNLPIQFKIPFDERDHEIAALNSKLGAV